MPGQAQQAAPKAGQKIKNQKAEVAKQAFRQYSDLREHRHIHDHVDDADVHEHVGEQAPPLAVGRQRAEIGAPAEQAVDAGLEHRNAFDDHDHEHQNVDTDQDGRDERRARSA